MGPIRILDGTRAAGIGRLFRRQYERSGIRSTRNRHVDLPAISALCEAPEIWYPAYRILGRRLMLWRTKVFHGRPALSWHEDRHAFFFDRSAFNLSMLLALTDSPPDNCTVFIPGSHRQTIREKERLYGIAAAPHPSGNVQYAGQVPAGFREPMPLRAGEMVVFHPKLLHASSGWVHGRREASAERLSLAFRVTTPDATLRRRAFAGGPGDRAAVLRVIERRPHQDAGDGRNRPNVGALRSSITLSIRNPESEGR